MSTQAVNSKDTVVNSLCVKYKSSRGVVDKGMWVLWYSVGLETTSLPHRLYRSTSAFGCVGSMCLCAFDVDFSLVWTWMCIGVVHIDTRPNRTVCTIRQNSSYFYSSN